MLSLWIWQELLRCLRLQIQCLKWFIQPSSLTHRTHGEKVALCYKSEMDALPPGASIALASQQQNWGLEVFLDVASFDSWRHWVDNDGGRGFSFLDPALSSANFLGIHFCSTSTCSVWWARARFLVSLYMTPWDNAKTSPCDQLPPNPLDSCPEYSRVQIFYKSPTNIFASAVVLIQVPDLSLIRWRLRITEDWDHGGPSSSSVLLSLTPPELQPLP